jgi:hypothetical protein
MAFSRRNKNAANSSVHVAEIFGNGPVDRDRTERRYGAFKGHPGRSCFFRRESAAFGREVGTYEILLGSPGLLQEGVSVGEWGLFTS